MKKRLLTALLLTVSVPSVGLAQRGVVSGRVVDQNGEPVGDVAIVIRAESDSGQPRTVETKDDGTFLIGGLNPGRYTISYEKEGHEKASQEVQVRIGERNRLEDIVLPKLPADYIRPEAQEHFEAGVAASDQQDYEKAVESFLATLELAPDVPEVHYNLGFAYERLEDVENATVHYKKALELRPDYYDPLIPLAEMHTARREWSEAAEYWKKAIALHPDELLAHYNYGAVSMNAGDLATAQAAFEKVLELDPGHALAHYQLGMIAVSEAQNEEAVVYLQRYLELDPQGAHAAAAKGIIETLTNP